jgi:hypothetical protein
MRETACDGGPRRSSSMASPGDAVCPARLTMHRPLDSLGGASGGRNGPGSLNSFIVIFWRAGVSIWLERLRFRWLSRACDSLIASQSPLL